MRRRIYGMLAMLCATICTFGAALWVRSASHTMAFLAGEHHVHVEAGVAMYGYATFLLIPTEPQFYDVPSPLPNGSVPLAVVFPPNGHLAFADGTTTVHNVVGWGAFELGTMDWGGWYVSVPLWFPTVLFGVGFLAFARSARRSSRLPPGACPACGYDLRASPQRCPECGAGAEGAAAPP